MGVQPEKKLFWKLVSKRFFFLMKLTVVLSSSSLSFSSSSSSTAFLTRFSSVGVWPMPSISFSTCQVYTRVTLTFTPQLLNVDQQLQNEQDRVSDVLQPHEATVVVPVPLRLIYLLRRSVGGRLEEGAFRTLARFLQGRQVSGNTFYRNRILKRVNKQNPLLVLYKLQQINLVKRFLLFL